MFIRWKCTISRDDLTFDIEVALRDLNNGSARGFGSSLTLDLNLNLLLLHIALCRKGDWARLRFTLLGHGRRMQLRLYDIQDRAIVTWALYSTLFLVVRVSLRFDWVIYRLHNLRVLIREAYVKDAFLHAGITTLALWLSRRHCLVHLDVFFKIHLNYKYPQS